MCREILEERYGKVTCDKLRPRTGIVKDVAPIYSHTDEKVNFDSFEGGS